MFAVIIPLFTFSVLLKFLYLGDLWPFVPVFYISLSFPLLCYILEELLIWIFQLNELLFSCTHSAFIPSVELLISVMKILISRIPLFVCVYVWQCVVVLVFPEDINYSSKVLNSSKDLWQGRAGWACTSLSLDVSTPWSALGTLPGLSELSAHTACIWGQIRCCLSLPGPKQRVEVWRGWLDGCFCRSLL